MESTAPFKTLPTAAWKAALLAAGLWAGGCSAPSHQAHPLPEPEPVQGEVLTLRKEAQPIYYHAAGQVQPLLRSTLSAKVMARVERVYVREGDRVKEGQLLASLDSRELRSGVQVAEAAVSAAGAGVATASTAANMEEKMALARVDQAQATLLQAQAGEKAAQAALDLALAGPRTQQKAQAQLTVNQAKSTLDLAEVELARAKRLVADGAMAKRQLDQAQNAYDLAKGQHDLALQALSIAEEGAREQEIRAAREAVQQARASVRQAQAGVQQARASLLQRDLRRMEVRAARSSQRQSQASLQSARVMLAHASVTAPFSGVVVKRMADPGALASPGAPLLEVEGGGMRLEAFLPESTLRHVRIGGLAQASLDALGDRPLTVRTVEIVPRGDQSSHSFLVKFELPAEAGAKSGMFGRVSVATGASQKLLIPLRSTWKRDGLDWVYVVDGGGRIRLRVVTLGRPAGDKVEALSGLNEGEKLFLGDRSKAQDGAPYSGEGQ